MYAFVWTYKSMVCTRRKIYVYNDNVYTFIVRDFFFFCSCCKIQHSLSSGKIKLAFDCHPSKQPSPGNWLRIVHTALRFSFFPLISSSWSFFLHLNSFIFCRIRQVQFLFWFSFFLCFFFYSLILCRSVNKLNKMLIKY